MNEEIHSTINVPKGGIQDMVVEPGLRKTKIDPKNPHPVSPRTFFNLPYYTLGKMEVLAHSQWLVSDYTKKTPTELQVWNEGDEADVWSIVNSVQASSRIEGEELRAEQVPTVFHAVTKTLGQRSQELSEREKAHTDITKAYFHALNQVRTPIVTVPFLLDLHQRMFFSTRPDIAGRLKKRPVFIADDESAFYNVETLPPAKVREFLEELCERFSKKHADSLQSPLHSKLLMIAEFILDFLAIHPFEDGNGRTARLLSTYLLERSGYNFARFYPLDQIIMDERNSYFRALFDSQVGWYSKDENLMPWIEFYVNAIFKQWERAFSIIRDNSAKLAT